MAEKLPHHLFYGCEVGYFDVVVDGFYGGSFLWLLLLLDVRWLLNTLFNAEYSDSTLDLWW